MKIRNGFVSNSSSSSFILEIDSKLNYDETLEAIVDCICSECDNYFNGRIELDKSPYLTYDQKKEYLVNKFKKEDIWKDFALIPKSNNKYEIIFWTAMRNEISDFGDLCSSLTMLLITDQIQDIKLLSAKMEDD